MKRLILLSMMVAATASAQSTPPALLLVDETVTPYAGASEFDPINYTPPALLLVDGSTRMPYVGASGVDPISYAPPAFVPYCTSTGSPPYSICSFSSSGGGTITSPNGTLAVGSSGSATTLDISAPVPIAYGGTGVVTAPTSAQLLVAQSGTAYAPKTVSGDGTLAANGALTVSSTNGTAFGTAATANTGTSGATIPLANGSTTFSGFDTFSNSPGTASGAYGAWFSGSAQTSSLYNPVLYIAPAAATAPSWTNEGPLLAINAPSGYNANAHLFEVDANGTAEAWVTSAGRVNAIGLNPSTATGFLVAHNDLYFTNPTAGVLSIGSGGGNNSDALIQAAAFQSTGTPFTVSGCSAGSVVAGAATGIFTLGANSCTVVVTLNGATGLTATHGWHCPVTDRTNPTVYIGGESSSTTTTCTIAIPATVGTSDVISFHADPF